MFANTFIDYDDPAYITGNPHIRAGLTVNTIAWAWTSCQEAGFWHPLTWISHAMDVELFGLNPAGHHFTSLVIHILNASLLFLLLSRLRGSTGRSFLAAAIFGLHPLAVESVSWAAERKNVLCTLFFLLAIAAYGRYAQRPSTIRYLSVMIAFFLGLAAKPMVVTLPLVLLLLDFWPLGRVQGYGNVRPFHAANQLKLKQLVLEKLPLLAMSACSGIVTLITQSSAGAIPSTAALSLTARLANASNSYFTYILTALWPQNLAPFYPEAPLPLWRICFAVICVFSVSIAVWLYRARRPYLMAGWFFYLGTLVPVIGIVQAGSQARADRFTYIPLIGIFFALVWLVSDLANEGKFKQRTQMLIAASLLASLAALTWRQVHFWRDDVTLWSYDLQVTNNNVVAEDNLGIALLQRGRNAEALAHFYRAASLDPADPISSVNLATNLLARGLVKEAIEKYEIALGQTSTASIPMLVPNIHSNLGSAFLILGNVEQARDHYELALRLNPDDPVARSGLARITSQVGIARADQ